MEMNELDFLKVKNKYLTKENLKKQNKPYWLSQLIILNDEYKKSKIQQGESHE